MVDREAVRSNAKYLRRVRPIDPEEIHEYVEGTPHPAVVRQVLREEAVDLGLIERDDGTFVPVPDDPVSPPGWSPTAFPGRYGMALEDRLVERFGANWHRGESGDALRETIRRFKADYLTGSPVEYDETTALGYAIYHLPDYYAAVGYVLDDLAERGLLPRRLSVCDVGAGVGGPALGLVDYLPDDALVDYHAVEPSAAADVLERVLAETGPNVHATIHRERAEAFDAATAAPGGAEGEDGDADAGFDLVLLGNVLSELDDPVAVVQRYLDALAPDGSLVALAPADLETATGLREVERAVAPPGGDVTVYSPTLRLWPDAAPSDRGWSFDLRPDLDVPGFQRRLNEAGDGDGEFVNVDVQYAYAILRTDGERRTPVTASPRRHARMADMERHVTERVDLLAVKLSRDLADGGNPVFKIGDGSETTGCFAVLARESALNESLVGADYGDVLAFENALVLWNDDEAAYNVVVDAETVVDFVA